MKLNDTFLKNINTIVDCNIDIVYQYNCFLNNKAIFNSKICQEMNYFAKHYEEYITALSNIRFQFKNNHTGFSFKNTLKA